MENPKDNTQKLLEPINEHSKVAGHKINIEINCISLHSNYQKGNVNKQSLLKLHQKYLEINLQIDSSVPSF